MSLRSLVWLAAGCATAPTLTPSATTPSDPGVTDVFPVQPGAIDVLFVASDTVADPLAESAPAFFDWLLGSGADFRVAVARADGASPGGVIDADTASPLDVFVQLATMTSEPGWGAERGLDAAYLAVGDVHRDGAALHTFVAADAPDESVLIDAPGFASWYAALADEAVFSCVCDPLGAYAEVAAATGGLQLSPADDWSMSLDALGAESFALALPTSFTLSQAPVADTIEVVVAEAGTAGVEMYGAWAYDATENRVSFDAYIPPAGSTVEIRYTPQP